MDVFPEEPTTESPLFDVENIVVTPHLGASTEEAQDRAGVVVAEQVAAALTGGVVTGAVNIPAISAEATAPSMGTSNASCGPPRCQNGLAAATMGTEVVFTHHPLGICCVCMKGYSDPSGSTESAQYPRSVLQSPRSTIDATVAVLPPTSVSQWACGLAVSERRT